MLTFKRKADDIVNIKQKMAADEYIICGDKKASMLKVGYSNNYATKKAYLVFDRDDVKEYIAKRMKEIEAETIANQTEVLQYLTRVLRDEESEETLVNVGNFEQEVRTVKLSAKDKIKAAELIGKRWGSWTDKVDVTSDLTLVFEDDYGDQDD